MEETSHIKVVSDRKDVKETSDEAFPSETCASDDQVASSKGLLDLPVDVLRRILEVLPLQDVLSVGETCSSLRYRAANNDLWLSLLARATCSRCRRCLAWAHTIDQQEVPVDGDSFYKRFFAVRYLRAIDVEGRRDFMAKTMHKRCVFCIERRAPVDDDLPIVRSKPQPDDGQIDEGEDKIVMEDS